MLPALLLLIAALASAPAQGRVPGRGPDLVLTGTITGSDHQSYKRIAFQLPAGVDQLVVDFDYDRREQKTVIDLGIEDVNGFRGASGGNKPSFVIAATEATPSYLPGPLPPGTWHLALAVPNIRQGVTAQWKARLWFLKAGEALPISASVTDSGPGWYRGDLHLHSAHSDGSCPSQSGARVPCPLFLTLQAAAARRLDFVAVTEHNSSSHHALLREAQPYFDRMILIPGREITTFHGHFNVFGVTEPLDFRLAPAGRNSFNALADRVHALGGIVAINHPAVPSGEACMGCGWTMPGADLRKADAVELVNGGSAAAENGNPEGRLWGGPFWLAALEAGNAITGIGASDSHDPTRTAGEFNAVGRPTTVVYAKAFTQRAILEGIRAGRVFVDLSGGTGTMLDLQLATDRGSAPMGAEIEATPGAVMTAVVRIAGVRNATVKLLGARGPLASGAVDGDAELRLPLRLAAGRHLVRAEVRSADGRLLLISNPVRALVR